MSSFVSKAERRGPVFSKEVLCPKEAGQLCAALGDQTNVAKEALEQLLGAMWEKKTNKFKLADQGDVLTLNREKLDDLARMAATPAELAAMVATFFRGAGKALAFMEGRMRNKDLDQYLTLSEGALAKALGPLWEARLAAAGIDYEY